MSPFERASDALADQLLTLTPRAQSLFFACVAAILLPRYDNWSDSATGAKRQLLRDAISSSRQFSIAGNIPEGAEALLQQLEQQAPSEVESSLAGFTVAQDAWTCADVALRIAVGGFEASDGLWYALEPQFQAVSERLFGFTDVGSDRQEEDEKAALNDPALAEAVSAINLVLRHLATSPVPTESDERLSFGLLLALDPGPQSN